MLFVCGRGGKLQQVGAGDVKEHGDYKKWNGDQDVPTTFVDGMHIVGNVEEELGYMNLRDEKKDELAISWHRKHVVNNVLHS